MSFGMSYGEDYGPYKNSINGERFVYYQRLKKDGFTDLYNKADSLMKHRIEVGASANRIAFYFWKLRDAEFEKEKRLLSTKLTGSIIKDYSYDNQTKDTGSKLIEEINELLNFKEVFKRNFALITQTKGQKGLIVYFNKYFDDLCEDSKKIEEITSLIEKEIKAGFSVKDAVEKVMNQKIPEMVRETLIYMFTSTNAENGINNDEFKDAYKELVPFLQKGNSVGEEFIQNIIKDYHLDRLLNDLVKFVDNTNWRDEIESFGPGKGVMHVEGGYATESLGDFIAKVVQDGVEGFSSIKSGATKQKADFIISYDLPTNKIENWLKTFEFGTREADVLAATSLQDDLDKLDEGFIIYSNAKNYTLNSDFKSRGFSAGSKINLETWDTMMHLVHKRGRDLIFMALQLIPGAIGQGNDEEVSQTFARAISSALFDDFDTIGKEQKSGINNIHVLYLNGIYIPLSFYYHLLYKAFNDFSRESVDNIVNVTIKYPSGILFPEKEDQEDWMKKHPGESPWNYQSKLALEATTIQYHFFREFQEEMKKLNIQF